MTSTITGRAVASWSLNGCRPKTLLSKLPSTSTCQLSPVIDLIITALSIVHHWATITKTPQMMMSTEWLAVVQIEVKYLRAF